MINKNDILSSQHKPLIIAEVSANHKKSLKHMLDVMSAAKRAGADAIKFQLYTANSITLNSNSEDFLLSDDNPWKDHKTLYQLYQHASTPVEWLPEIFSHARSLEIDIFASVFDAASVDLMEKYDPIAYKIASPEITDVSLIEKVASTGKAVILSTGLSDADDLNLAIETLKRRGCNKYIILKCTSAYPCPIDEVNLATMHDISRVYSCPVGFSDHTIGIGASIAASVLGASIIEKHFTLDKENSTDGFFSLNESEFEMLVREIRSATKSIGRISYDISKSAKRNIQGRRSIYVSKDIEKGELFTTDNLKSVRPAWGLHPKYLKDILGKKSKEKLLKGSRMKLNYID